MEQSVKIKSTTNLSATIKKIIVERPENYDVVPGQYTKISLPGKGLSHEGAPFSIAEIGDDYLGFVIKTYPEGRGLSTAICDLQINDEIIISEAKGKISYQGEGVFIAGGIGITPFLAIFNWLKKNNRVENNSLIFSNKKEEDIVLGKELESIFEDKVTFVLTQEEKPGCDSGRIDKEYLKKKIADFSQYFYLCGPYQFVQEMIANLEELGATKDKIVHEGWRG